MLKQTTTFTKWFKTLKDTKGKAIILARIQRAAAGNFGDAKNLKGRLYEMRIAYGPAYRIYFTKEGDEIIILLCGGDKSSQSKDIEKARAILEEIL